MASRGSVASFANRRQPQIKRVVGPLPAAPNALRAFGPSQLTISATCVVSASRMTWASPLGNMTWSPSDN